MTERKGKKKKKDKTQTSDLLFPPRKKYQNTQKKDPKIGEGKQTGLWKVAGSDRNFFWTLGGEKQSPSSEEE